MSSLGEVTTKCTLATVRRKTFPAIIVPRLPSELRIETQALQQRV